MCKGTLNFDLYQCFVTQAESRKEQFKVTIKGTDLEFWFRAENEADAASWVLTINLHIKHSQGHKKQAFAPNTIKFWKRMQISEEQFLSKADTFDILLFSSNTNSAKVVRAYSGSEFDHAAMVVRLGSMPDDIFVFEATSSRNIAIKRFSGIQHMIGSFYSKVVLRHLEWTRTDQAMEILDKFM